MREPPPEPERYLTGAELARILSVSIDTVKRMRKAGMPSVTWGERAVRYRLSDVEAWRRERER